MSNRIALFAEKEEIEKFFQFETDRESIFEPHYNIAPAQHIAVIFNEGGSTEIGRARWGLESGDDKKLKHIIDIDEAAEGIKKGKFSRCIVPVSGYYKWKNVGKRANNPFFIRMIEEPVMALTGVLQTETANGNRDQRSCAIVNTEANALVQPLDPEMPLQLDRELSLKWLDEKSDHKQVLEKAKKLFLLTDMSAMRVSAKVNDLTVNSPKLIQPLPK
jgi:putative SOS response-associated peptidase YedK